jgi:hypothetical protein
MPRKMAPWRIVFESYPCHTCGAAPGEHCMSSSGHVRNETHVERGREAMRCHRCGGRLAFDAEPGDLCGRCEQVRALEVERSTTWKRRRSW